MDPSYYRRVDATGGCPKPDKGIKIAPTGKKKRRTKSRLGFSVQRLRIRVARFFRVLKRWRRRLCPYGRCVLPWKPPKSRSEDFGWRSRSSSSSTTSSSSSASKLVYSGSGNYKFYSEAIADCLEFIKRNSISLDEKKDLISSLSDVC
ncbi:hypothetical protein MLD38_028722 [Melastoma candidum]|uniref:Uncharacterized protein n=1 Tax=Melastoma candidum TaxID=119954 RepID=A0ACB9N1J7_9MYRT|nr:hypothetical protein MLD38_028722 [Melastoma candidum]